MEDELWRELYGIVKQLAKGKRRRCTYSAADVLLVYLFGVLRDRSTNWACQRRHWPIWHRRRRKIPSASTMSRRMKDADVQGLFVELEQSIRSQSSPSLCRWIDGKPLPIGASSQDRDAGFGRAAGAMAKGYKMHAIADEFQGFVVWDVQPMNVHESTVAEGLIPQLEGGRYLVGDNAYDGNKLYDAAARCGVQLVAPRRASAQGLGHHRHSPHRLRAIELLQEPLGQELLHSRRGIERLFGQLTTLPCGLSPLPSWVRGLKRVTNWVRGKIIYFMLWRNLRRASTT
jgi:Transposase DDE domain